MRFSEIAEAWSEKYKRSINCNNPKGFSQRAHCQGRKKKRQTTEGDLIKFKPREDKEIDLDTKLELAMYIINIGKPEGNIFKNNLKQRGLKFAVDNEVDPHTIIVKFPDGKTGRVKVDELREILLLHAYQHGGGNIDIDEGMGASAGGGTPGSAGAGGSSLGLPYPSTYEEENDKFKSHGQERTVAMTTEQKKLYKRKDLPQLNLDMLTDSPFKLFHKTVDISKLKPVQKERVKGLVQKTIKAIESGLRKPIVIDRHGYIVNGHHRYDAYKKLDISHVPVILVKATIEELIDKYM